MVNSWRSAPKPPILGAMSWRFFGYVLCTGYANGSPRIGGWGASLLVVACEDEGCPEEGVAVVYCAALVVGNVGYEVFIAEF